MRPVLRGLRLKIETDSASRRRLNLCQAAKLLTRNHAAAPLRRNGLSASDRVPGSSHARTAQQTSPVLILLRQLFLHPLPHMLDGLADFFGRPSGQTRDLLDRE